MAALIQKYFTQTVFRIADNIVYKITLTLNYCDICEVTIYNCEPKGLKVSSVIRLHR